MPSGDVQTRLPEFAQPLDAPFRRIAGDQRRVDRADRNARDPVGMQIGLGQRLIDAGLIRAERAAALQQQGDPFELCALAAFGTGLARRWING